MCKLRPVRPAPWFPISKMHFLGLTPVQVRKIVKSCQHEACFSLVVPALCAARTSTRGQRRHALLHTPVNLVAFCPGCPSSILASRAAGRGRVPVRAHKGACLAVQRALARGLVCIDVREGRVCLARTQALGVCQVPFAVYARDAPHLFVAGLARKVRAGRSAFRRRAGCLGQIDVRKRRGIGVACFAPLESLARRTVDVWVALKRRVLAAGVQWPQRRQFLRLFHQEVEWVDKGGFFGDVADSGIPFGRVHAVAIAASQDATSPELRMAGLKLLAILIGKVKGIFAKVLAGAAGHTKTVLSQIANIDASEQVRELAEKILASAFV